MNTRQQHCVRRYLWGWWLCAVACLVLFWLAGPLRADDPQGESSSVIYQVTYKDKSIRNLSDLPRTNKGILMVTRITRTHSSLPGTETISTGNQSMEMLNPGRTQETQLSWNGKAWVSAVKINRKPMPVRRHRPARPAEESIETTQDDQALAQQGVSREAFNAVKAQEMVQAIMESLSVADRALRQAESQMAMAESSPAAIQDAKRNLAEAQHAQQDVMTTLIQLKNQLGIRHISAPRGPSLAGDPAEAPYDPNRPIVPPATLTTNVAANGNFGYGWAGAGNWPVFGGDVMIQSQEPNPDFDTGPRVIIREQE